MRVCITEKPSVAKDIAKILGANQRCDGYYEGNGYRVTWTYGHLCSLKEPADYTDAWKSWSLVRLPMLPERFGIKVIHQSSIERQFKVIESLIAQADEVINCGDAGQEGELIQRWVMQKACIKCPVKRLWISSLTDESIRQGFQNLRPESDFDSLYHAGLSRAIGDWILGINSTRLYTLKYASNRGTILSVGRVQTPTLALIVQRQKEIENFKSEDFWEIATVYRDVNFNSRTGRYTSEADAKAVIGKISGRPFTITDIEEKQGRETPPRLFDLTSLQVECNKKWGWTAEETLRLIQQLYEKKVTTYPRVDTTYLSTDIHAKIPEILRKMTPYAPLTASILSKPITKTKRIFDNSKVTDHHAIIPTGESPTILSGNEKHLYHLIALRFIAAFYPDCLFEATTVTGKVEDVEFRANGKVITDEGWRKVIGNTGNAKDESNKSDSEKEDNADDGNTILPAFVVGESGSHKPKLLKRATQPPKLYTEGTLLRAMETAGKTVDDEALREAMKENGIGRPSTRSAIIETLFRRNYIDRKRKSIVATSAGIALIDIIKQPLLKSAKLTGLWENKLRKIERKEYSAAEFINELRELIHGIVNEVIADNSSQHIEVEQGKDKSKKVTKRQSGPKPTKAEGSRTSKPRTPAIKSFDQIVCPECGEGHILKGRTAYGCSNYASGCPLRLSFETYSPDLTPAQLNKKINSYKKKP